MRPRSTTLYLGPWQRKSPFFDASLRSGASAFDIYNHMLIPGYYGDPVEEYWHLLTHVTLWDVAVERIVEISGPDAGELTNRLTCRDLTRCAVGQCKYAPIIAPDGGIVNDPVLLRVEEDRWWLALADSDAGLYAIGVAAYAGLDVRVTHPDVYPVQVQGPRSKELVRALAGEAVGDLGYYRCTTTDLDGITVVIGRTGWTGEVGFEIYLMDPDRADDLWALVLDAGEPYNIRVIAPSEARRIEAGIFNYGSDMTLENNPFEVMGMERLVEVQDADYLGKDVLERVRREGVSRKLVGIEVFGEELPYEITDFWMAFSGDERVGKVTDLIWSPRLKKNIGYVWVPIALASPGSRLAVRSENGEMLEAETRALPFVDPNKETPAA